MHIIKLDAIDSTNTFLKDLIKHDKTCADFTVVWAENQKSGRGQRGAKWESEPYKNLTFSVLIRIKNIQNKHVFFHNKYVACSVAEVLSDEEIPKISIKWPNDIMSSNKKIGGILIENRFLESGIIESVVGIGLNVNQRNFNGLPQASSIYEVSGKGFDLKVLLTKIVESLERNFSILEDKLYDDIDVKYHQFLFKKEIPVAFQGLDNEIFMGCIQGVDTLGKVHIRREDDSVVSYSVKEVKMLF